MGIQHESIKYETDHFKVEGKGGYLGLLGMPGRNVFAHLRLAAAEWLLRMTGGLTPDTPSKAWQAFEDSVTAPPLRLDRVRSFVHLS